MRVRGLLPPVDGQRPRSCPVAAAPSASRPTGVRVLLYLIPIGFIVFYLPTTVGEPREEDKSSSRPGSTVKATTRTRQCIGFLIQLATASGEEGPLSLAAISTRTGISRRYLEQLAILLKNAGLIVGVTGRRGGYMLARNAEDITIHDIVTAASGPVSFAGCVADSMGCMSAEYCQCRPLWMLIDHEIEKVLNAHRLDELVDRSRLDALRARANGLPRRADASSPWTDRTAPEIARGGG